MSTALANGQISTRLRINLAGAQPQPAENGVAFPESQVAEFGTRFVNGQFSPGNRFIAQQLTVSRLNQGKPLGIPSTNPVFRFSQPSPAPPSPYVHFSDPSNVQYIDGSEDENVHILFKRNENNKKKTRRVTKREVKKNAKRALVQLTDGSLIDDRDLAENPHIFDGLAQFGAVKFQEGLTKQGDIEDEIKQHDREPAEGEVEAVLSLCSSCEVEPFQGAIILAWKDVNIKIEDALKGRSLGGCGNF